MQPLEGKVFAITGASRGIGAATALALAREGCRLGLGGRDEAALPALLDGGGDLVIVASVAGLKGLPNESVYCASKHAQVGFAEALDHELRPRGVRVTAMCPGGVATGFAFGAGRTPDMPELREMISADQVAEAIVFALRQDPQLRTLRHVMRPMSEPA